ncbi:hypothetical protein GGS20DRAFT_540831 [Poronia punctata]|nr:hypothetical protein GGS20DRAFT_540831 [Poronia punctata]
MLVHLSLYIFNLTFLGPWVLQRWPERARLAPSMRTVYIYRYTRDGINRYRLLCHIPEFVSHPDMTSKCCNQQIAHIVFVAGNQPTNVVVLTKRQRAYLLTPTQDGHRPRAARYMATHPMCIKSQGPSRDKISKITMFCPPESRQHENLHMRVRMAWNQQKLSADIH